jgi:hypothetical protein
MRIVCWIPKAMSTRSKYVVVIAFPLQQGLHEHAAMLRYTFIAHLVVCRTVLQLVLLRAETTRQQQVVKISVALCMHDP